MKPNDPPPQTSGDPRSRPRAAGGRTRRRPARRCASASARRRTRPSGCRRGGRRRARGRGGGAEPPPGERRAARRLARAAQRLAVPGDGATDQSRASSRRWSRCSTWCAACPARSCSEQLAEVVRELLLLAARAHRLVPRPPGAAPRDARSRSRTSRSPERPPGPSPPTLGAWPTAPQTWILTGSPENFAATREHGFTVIGLKERRRDVRRADRARRPDRPLPDEGHGASPPRCA